MAAIKTIEDQRGLTLAFFCITIIGIGYLFPISAVWAAFDYWKILFPSCNIEFAVTCVYQVGSLVTVFVLMIGKSYKLGPRIVGGFTGQWCCLAVIFCFRWMSLSSDVLFWLLLFVVLLCSVTTGFLDSAVLALCSQYSPKMQQFLQLGIGLGTMVSVLYRDLTKLILSGDVADATSFYFFIALVTVVVCISCYKLLMTLPVSKEVVAGDVGKVDSEPISPVAVGFISPGGQRHNDLTGPLLDVNDKQDPASDAPLMDGKTDFRSIWSIVWFNQIVAFLNFALTMLCYPGLITSIPCRQFKMLEPENWFQTALLTAFTFSDIIGRLFTDEKWRCGLNYKNIWYTIIVRLLAFPVMIYCILNENASDLLGFAVVSFFGALNGFSVSLSLIVMNQIPGMNNDQRKTCGRMSACAVNGGLCAGSLAGGAVAMVLGLNS